MIIDLEKLSVLVKWYVKSVPLLHSEIYVYVCVHIIYIYLHIHTSYRSWHVELRQLRQHFETSRTVVQLFIPLMIRRPGGARRWSTEDLCSPWTREEGSSSSLLFLAGHATSIFQGYNHLHKALHFCGLWNNSKSKGDIWPWHWIFWSVFELSCHPTEFFPLTTCRSRGIFSRKIPTKIF